MQYRIFLALTVLLLTSLRPCLAEMPSFQELAYSDGDGHELRIKTLEAQVALLQDQVRQLMEGAVTGGDSLAALDDVDAAFPDFQVVIDKEGTWKGYTASSVDRQVVEKAIRYFQGTATTWIGVQRITVLKPGNCVDANFFSLLEDRIEVPLILRGTRYTPDGVKVDEDDFNATVTLTKPELEYLTKNLCNGEN